MASKFNPIGIIAVIGAVLMVVGVFLNWMDITTSVVGFEKTTSYSGWEVFNNEDLAEGLEYSFAPIVTLVLGILCLIFTIVPMARNGKAGKVLTALALLMSIVTVIMCILFYTDITSELDLEIVVSSVSAGAGLWVSLVGSILVIIGGMANLVKKTE